MQAFALKESEPQAMNNHTSQGQGAGQGQMLRAAVVDQKRSSSAGQGVGQGQMLRTAAADQNRSSPGQELRTTAPAGQSASGSLLVGAAAAVVPTLESAKEAIARN